MGDIELRAWQHMMFAQEIERLCAERDELLAALKRLVTDYEDVPDPTDSDGQAVFADARAAIAKAEGK